jgi:hypothetical protein
LRIRADIAPDERGTDYLTMFVEHDGAVHLPGETDAGNFIGAEAGLLDRFRNGYAAGAPPVVGMLLGPTDLGRGEGSVIFGRGRNDVTVLIDDQGTCTAGSDIDAENVNRSLLGGNSSPDLRSLLKERHFTARSCFVVPLRRVPAGRSGPLPAFHPMLGCLLEL